ncbi:hypothetical protein LTR53_001249 [Teratosphaeriaceae sp. CCFEE 6253]|nr:hypothetical protein LTR53_001249 [Teratosphaeriaceae sp. CCFEE 6253]
MLELGDMGRRHPPAMFEFISVADRSEMARSRNQQRARSHTSKVNRRRTLLRKSSSQGNFVRREPLVRPSSTASGARFARGGDRPGGDDLEARQQSELYLPKPVSPTFGALVAHTFSPGRARGPGETADYYFHYVLGSFMAKSEINWYLQAYCSQPLVFHALTYSAANHQDRMRGEIKKTRSAEIIAHKLEAIRLLNRSLSDLGSIDPEPLLMAMTCLWRKEPSEDQLKPDPMLLFRPHLPKVNGIDIYGRGKLNQTDPVHRKAMSKLLEHADILTLKCTGMSKAVAGHDLIVVSQSLARPRLPNVWTNKALIASLMLDHGVGAGNGFVEHVPGGLPAEMLSTLTYLSAADRALGHLRGKRVSDNDAARLRFAVNDVHHRVMSLQAWAELDDDNRGTSHPAIYECCRLTAVLYSNAVLFPLPVASGWHLELLRRLRLLIESAGTSTWMGDTSSLLIWSSCIACVAAFGTRELEFFAAILRQGLMWSDVTSFEDMRDIVQDYLWTDSACKPGARMIWDELNLGGAIS